jgi:hypothetical protein
MSDAESYVDERGMVWFREPGDASAKATHDKWRARTPEQVDAIAAAYEAAKPDHDTMLAALLGNEVPT